MIDEVLDGDATSVAAAIRAGDVSVEEVVDRTLERIDERNPKVNAIVERCDDAARRTANEAPGAPLAGVPFVIKDLGMSVEGMRATGGSRLFSDVVASEDSLLVSRFRRAGLVIVGTSNSSELGRAPTTEPLLHGPTRNPRRLTHSVGGSSGGTAASISSGMVPAGHGTDGGGSIRIPAAACGLVGLKPSRGRVPAAPANILMSNPQSINGALARSVRDAALLLDVAAGHTGGDPFVISAPAGPYRDEVERDPGTCRIALSVSAPNGGSTDPECVAATEAVAATFAELGHHVEIAAPDWPLEALSNSISTFMAAGLAADVGQRLAELGRDLHDDDLELLTRRMFEMGRTLPASAMVVALQNLERAARIIGAFFADHDVLLTPTISRRVPPLGLIDTSDMDSLTHAAAMATYTSPFNVTGQPAISLPAAVDSEGLPIGVQLAAAFGREDLLIRVASQLERARPSDTAPVWPPRT